MLLISKADRVLARDSPQVVACSKTGVRLVSSKVDAASFHES